MERQPAHNPPLTASEFREYPGCSKYCEEEAENIVQGLRAFARLVFQNYRLQAETQMKTENGDFTAAWEEGGV